MHEGQTPSSTSYTRMGAVDPVVCQVPGSLSTSTGRSCHEQEQEEQEQVEQEQERR